GGEVDRENPLSSRGQIGAGVAGYHRCAVDVFVSRTDLGCRAGRGGNESRTIAEHRIAVQIVRRCNVERRSGTRNHKGAEAKRMRHGNGAAKKKAVARVE